MAIAKSIAASSARWRSPGLGEFEWDWRARPFVVSARMAAITGLPAGPMPARAAEGAGALHPSRRPGGLPRRRDSQRPAGGVYEFEFRHVRPDDGRVVWLRVAGVMQRSADGRPLNVTGIVEDITARKLEEDQRQTLMAELDHRVKNVLATVQALAVQTARRTTSLDGLPAELRRPAEGHGLGQRAAHRRPLARRRHRPPGRRRAGRAGARPDRLGGPGAVPDARARPMRWRSACTNWPPTR